MKKIELMREMDELFVFMIGGGEVIFGFEEVVAGMKVGGVRRIEISGELEEKFGYLCDKVLRYNVGLKLMFFGG